MKKICIVFQLLFPLTIFCQTYDFHPKSSFTLGYGVDLRDIEDGKIISPFKLPIKSVFENPDGTPSTGFYQSLILTEEDLDKSFKLDANISARYLGYSASASYNINKRELLNTKNLTILLSGENNYGKEYITVTKDDLTEDAKKLIADKKYDDFINQYGNYVVNKVERVSRINIYLTLNSMDKSSKESITASAEGGAQVGAFSGSVSVNINSEINKAYKSRNFTINLQSNGDTSGFKGLRDLLDLALSNNDPISTINNTIKNYLNQFSRQSSAISKYYLSSVTSLGIPKQSIKWNTSTDNYLKDISIKYDKITKLQEGIESMISNSSFIALSTAQEQSQLNSEQNDIQVKLQSLLSKKDNCLSTCQKSDVATCCNVNNISIPNIPIYSKYSRLLKRLSFRSDDIKFIKQNEEYTLIDEKSESLKNKRIKLKIRFYAIPTLDEQPFEATYNIVGNNPIVNLIINGKVVQNSCSVEKAYIIPFPLRDNFGNITGYTNNFIFSLDNYLIQDTDNLKISIKYTGIQEPYNQFFKNAAYLKFHPDLSFNCSIIE